MKTNFKIGDRITVLRLPHFDSVIGTVLSNDTRKQNNHLAVILDNQGGGWNFSYNECTLLIDDPNIARNESKPEKAISTKPNKIMAKTGVKRAYTKRVDKPIIDKPKRKYTKKVKS